MLPVAALLSTCTASLLTVSLLPPLLQAEPGAEAEAAALRALAALRLRAKKDVLPARVADGLFIGGAGAARNLKALRKRGITHIVNAAPAVPCHFRDNPEGAFEYLPLPLFDDPDAGGCWVGALCTGCLCWLSLALPDAPRYLSSWWVLRRAGQSAARHLHSWLTPASSPLLSFPHLPAPLQTCCRTLRPPMPSSPAHAPAAALSLCTATPGRAGRRPWSLPTSCKHKAWVSWRPGRSPAPPAPVPSPIRASCASWRCMASALRLAAAAAPAPPGHPQPSSPLTLRLSWP